MSDKLNQTQRILRSPKVRTDDRGRTVWAGSVDTANLELMSTQQLQRVIEKGNTQAADQLRKLTASADGLLARNVDNGEFEIVSDDELRELLDDTPTDSGTEEELSLVSTQMLRVLIHPEDKESDAAEKPAQSGFNPYDHN